MSQRITSMGDSEVHLARSELTIKAASSPLGSLPSSEPIFVQVGLRALRRRWGETTAGAADRLLTAHLAVPSFTYSFTRTGTFHRRATPAEVGGFAEHVRRRTSAAARSLDPIFSSVDALGTATTSTAINTDAFGDGSIWHRWDQLDGWIANIGTSRIIATQVHYIETRCQVPYRAAKVFPGTVTDEIAATSTPVNYRYPVRDLDEDPKMDFERRRRLLEADGTLHGFDWEGVEVTYLRATALRRTIEKALREDPRALLKPSSDRK